MAHMSRAPDASKPAPGKQPEFARRPVLSGAMHAGQALKS